MTDDSFGHFTDLLVAVALLVGLIAALELGFRRGRRGRTEGEAKSVGQVGAVQAAILGLLGLLLGFSFAGAGERFLEKQDIIMREANAISTASLRAELLAEPYSTELRRALREYTEHRLEVAPRLRRGISDDVRATAERLHAVMWRAVAEAIKASPPPHVPAITVLDPVNQVIDLHAIRVATSRKHLPPLVMGLLVGCSLLAVGAIGYGCGLSDRRFVAMTLPLVILVAVTLWTIIDLDHPRGGLIRLSDAPLEAIRIRP